MGGAAVGIIAGWTDWRWRRIPNWLTVSGCVAGLAANSWAGGWHGAKASLLGTLLGLGLLLPFVWIRSLGAGDWKLVGALGAFLGPERLMAVLFAAILVAGIMAVALIVWKHRVRESLRNLWGIVGALFSMHLPGGEVSLDNPQSLKVPFGVAVAVAVVVYTAFHLGSTG
jgi:prepilin peptidase CpaA